MKTPVRLGYASLKNNKLLSFFSTLRTRQYRIWGKKFFSSSVKHLICLLVVITCLIPLVWMVGSSLKTRASVFSDLSFFSFPLQVGNYLEAWTKGRFGVYFLNSIFYTVVVVLSVLIISSLAGYGISRLKLPGKNIIFIILISTMMIPIPGAFIALYVLLAKLGLINTRIGYILCLINGGLALAIFLFKSFFDQIPKDLEDAACIDGCGKFRVYLHIALPLAKPVIAIVTIFNVLNVWNEYILAMLVFSDKALMPIQRGLMIFQGAYIADYHLLMAGITITVIPVIIVYFFMQKYIISGIMAGALKS